jgi:hypothetical protein
LRMWRTTTGSDTTTNALGPNTSLYTPPHSRNLVVAVGGWVGGGGGGGGGGGPRRGGGGGGGGGGGEHAAGFGGQEDRGSVSKALGQQAAAHRAG